LDLSTRDSLQARFVDRTTLYATFWQFFVFISASILVRRTTFQGASMFIYRRPVSAVLAGLVTASFPLVLDHLIELSVAANRTHLMEQRADPRPPRQLSPDLNSSVA
jgi:hypothetical protein